MFLNGELIEQVYLSDQTLWVKGRIEGAINELKEDYEPMLNRTDQQPQFTLLDYQGLIHVSP